MQFELDALRHAGIAFEVDEHALRSGELRLSFTHTVDTTEVHGEAAYPDSYPYFRPHVVAEPLGVVHHQNPLDHNLCLLGRGDDLWQPSYTLAWLLTEQLPLLLRSGRQNPTADAIAAEDPQAEPYSAYIPYQENSAALVDGSWRIPPGRRWGRLLVGTRQPKIDASAVHVAVLKVQKPDGRTIAAADPRLAQLYPYHHDARWARSSLSSPGNLGATIGEAARRIGKRSKREWKPITTPTGYMRLLGVVIPEEVAHRESGDGWFFVALTQAHTNESVQPEKSPVVDPIPVRPVYSGREDLALRVPELRPMRSKTVALFGLGTLGAPSALEFARAGAGELRILDGDIADAGPSVRWSFGLAAVGRPKVDIVREFLEAHHPYTRVSAKRFTLGAPPTSDGEADQQVVNVMLTGADLVFDATANTAVQKYLSDVARRRGIPYVSVVGRHGAWGGVIFRADPGRETGCWHCLQAALQAGGEIPDAPSADPTGIQPRGCGDVTFTGTSFDMGTIALEGVRRAVASLCANEGGYPDFEWDVMVLSLRGEDGRAVVPSWRAHLLPPRATCGCFTQ